MITKVNFQAGNEDLSGQIVSLHHDSHPEILFLHGAGQATKERALPIMEKLAEAGIDSFSFDFSGHGESTGILNASSLKKRVAEANEALKYLDDAKEWSICAFSMGGHIALELLKTHPKIKNLFLFYPGIYTQEAYNVPFDERFSTIIRQENSWQNAMVVDSLESFAGNLLVVIGENDKVIPKGVIEMIDKKSTNAVKKEIIWVPNAEHLLLPVIFNDKKLFDCIVQTIVAYIKHN